jgi:NifB/MoaA-like Fe-S oxidoreductase
MIRQEISGGVVHEMPADLRKALMSDETAQDRWEDLTPLARNEWICWTITVKQPETRKNHIERTITELLEGKRRPCCWYGCTHRTDKAVSHSVQKVLIGKQNRD